MSAKKTTRWALILMTILFQATSQAREIPLYPPHITDEVRLQQTSAPFQAMDEKALIALVPPQTGFYWSGCPNCKQGAQDKSLYWDLSLGGKVQCGYCKAIFPSEQYPDNKQIEVSTPNGGKQTFKYYEAPDGKKYWFEARRWYEQRTMLEKAAYCLAQLYRADPVKNAEAGRRAAAILKRFAEVYPGYIVHFDYPGQPKQFRPGSGVEGYEDLTDGPYRLTKWAWWAYMDISQDLVLAYDQLAGSPLLQAVDRKRIEDDLFGGMVDFVDQYKDITATNMHPILWEAQAVAARVLERPELAERVLNGLRGMVTHQFTADGFWIQPTVSYHIQTTNGLRLVLAALHPDLKGEALDAFVQREYPDLSRALNADKAFRLPNGHYAALGDTWANEIYSSTPILHSQPYLLPNTGYGVLGFGQGDKQLQAHLNFTGRFGHQHYASLNLLLFGAGKELVSDLGYTHSIAHPWTLSTASHNTVIVDGESQVMGEAPDYVRGDLRLYETTNADFQAIEAAAPAAYAPKTTDYRRALIAVQAPDGAQYVVDIFHVKGGKRHDWILHGSADDDQQLRLATGKNAVLALQPLDSLLPNGFVFKTPATEDERDLVWNGPWAYGNFRDIQQGTSAETIKATFINTAEPAKGLQSWILGAPRSTFFTTKSWAVRGAHENETKLNDYLRSSLIVRREGGTSRFVAVHVPFAGAPTVQNVTQLPWHADGVLLKIEHLKGVDYVLYQSEAKRQPGSIAGKPFQFDGRIALIRIEGGRTHLKSLGKGTFTYGNLTAKG